MKPYKSIESDSHFSYIQIQEIYDQLRLDLSYDNFTSAMQYYNDGRTQVLPSLNELESRVDTGWGDECIGFARLLKKRLIEAGYLEKNLEILRSLDPKSGLNKIHVALMQRHVNELYYYDPTILPCPILLPQEDAKISFEFEPREGFSNQCDINRRQNNLNIKVTSLTGHYILFEYDFDLSSQPLNKEELSKIYLRNIENLEILRLVHYERCGYKIELGSNGMSLPISHEKESFVLSQISRYCRRNKISEKEQLISNFQKVYNAILNKRNQ